MDAVLSSIMKPLARYFDEKDVIEVRVNEPCRVVVDRRGRDLQYYDDDSINIGRIEHICRALVNRHGMDRFDPDKNPKVSCIIPDVRHRFECLVGASVQGGISLAIRCKHPFVPTWDQLDANQAVQEYLYDAVATTKNIVISGATNTGKTTLLNMMLEIVPSSRRVIAVEDTPELQLDKFDHPVGLLADRDSSTKKSGGRVSWQNLYDHIMRITPDHIIFGEISTENAWPALAALNSGVTGFMCTIHAESPHQVLNRKFQQNITWSGKTMHDVDKYLTELIDVVVQIKRGTDGYRKITEIYEPKTNTTVFPRKEEVKCA